MPTIRQTGPSLLGFANFKTLLGIEVVKFPWNMIEKILEASSNWDYIKLALNSNPCFKKIQIRFQSSPNRSNIVYSFALLVATTENDYEIVHSTRCRQTSLKGQFGCWYLSLSRFNCGIMLRFPCIIYFLSPFQCEIGINYE